MMDNKMNDYSNNKGLKIDLGCGAKKKAGTIGIDFNSAPGVDYVLDLTRHRLPFNDRSVSYVFSSHFLEHITDSTHLFREISRVCEEGAVLEFWTPYGWSNSAFLQGHLTFYNEDHYLHRCVTFSDHWTRKYGARWVLREFQYVILPEILCDLHRNRISVNYAVQHLHNIVFEIGVHLTISHDLATPIIPVRKTFSLNRKSERYLLNDEVFPHYTPQELAAALKSFPKAMPIHTSDATAIKATVE